jgi:hypothetical protein
MINTGYVSISVAESVYLSFIHSYHCMKLLFDTCYISVSFFL